MRKKTATRVLLISPLHYQGFSSELRAPALEALSQYVAARGFPIETMDCLDVFAKALRAKLKKAGKEDRLIRRYHALQNRSTLKGSELDLCLAIAGYFFPNIERRSMFDTGDISARAFFTLWMDLYGAKQIEDLMRYRRRVSGDGRRPKLFEGIYREEVIPAIKRLKPEVIGCSCLTLEQVNSAILLAETLLRYYRKIPVLLGGAAATMIPDEEKEVILRDHPAVTGIASFDGCCVIESLARGDFFDKWKRFPNLIMRRGNNICWTNRRHIVSKCVTAEAIPKSVDPERGVRILAAQGCGWGRCAFCDLPFLENSGKRFMRFKNTRRLAREIIVADRLMTGSSISLKAAYLRPEDIRVLSKELQGEKLRNSLSLFLRCDVQQHDKTLFIKLASLGDVAVTFGVESLSDRTLRSMRKGYTAATAVNAIRAAGEAGLKVHINLIAGFPGESLEDVHRTRAALKEICPYIVAVHISPFHLSMWSQMASELKAYPIKILPEKRRLLSFLMPFMNLRPTAAEQHAIMRCYKQIEKMCARMIHARLAIMPAQPHKEILLRLHPGTRFAKMRYGYRLSGIRRNAKRTYAPRPVVHLEAQGDARRVDLRCLPYLVRMKETGSIRLAQIPPNLRSIFNYLISDDMIRAESC